MVTYPTEVKIEWWHLLPWEESHSFLLYLPRIGTILGENYHIEELLCPQFWHAAIRGMMAEVMLVATKHGSREVKRCVCCYQQHCVSVQVEIVMSKLRVDSTSSAPNTVALLEIFLGVKASIENLRGKKRGWTRMLHQWCSRWSSFSKLQDTKWTYMNSWNWLCHQELHNQ